LILSLKKERVRKYLELIGDHSREIITDFAREIFPGDPARVDYPFFLYGRGMNSKNGMRDEDTCCSMIDC